MANEQNQGQQPAEEQKQNQTPVGDPSEQGNEQKRAPGTEREYPGDTPEQRRGPGQEEDDQTGEPERKRA